MDDAIILQALDLSGQVANPSYGDFGPDVASRSPSTVSFDVVGALIERKLRLAMKREEKALRLYNELAQKTDDEACIQVFKLLSQEEAKHKQFLETMYDDFMAAQGD